MLEITVIHVGNTKESYYKEALSEYEKRLSAYCNFTSKEIKEQPLGDDPSKGQIDAALEKEADAVLAAVPQRALIISLCVEGKKLSSEGLAEYIERSLSEYSKICFVIGSSYGLSERVKKASALRLSFSDMTFPHRLMRVMLSEQIYRAFTINFGKTYHK